MIKVSLIETKPKYPRLWRWLCDRFLEETVLYIHLNLEEDLTNFCNVYIDGGKVFIYSNNFPLTSIMVRNNITIKVEKK